MLDICNWVIQCADRYLGPLYDYLHNRMYRFHVLQADETLVKVSKDGRPANSKSYMWVYRTGKGYGDTPIILYEYQKTRKADHPWEFLKGFTGVVVCDGYSAGYSCAGVPLFRRNGYRQSSGRKPLFRNRDTALN